jgi:PAS domain S-box-containing protein
VAAVRRQFETLAKWANGTEAGRDELHAALDELTHALGALEAADEESQQHSEQLSQARVVLEAQRRRYQDLFEFAPDGYLVTDPFGIIQEANRAAAALLNLRREYLVGTPLVTLMAAEVHSAFGDRLVNLRTRPEAERLEGWEVRLAPRQRASIDAAVTVAPIRDAEERVTGLRWLLRDVTALKQAERLAAVGEMMAGLAHESRNALQRGHACLELLAHEVRDRPHALELIDRLRRAQEHLARLFEEVRQFAGPVRTERKPCRLAEVWRQAWDELAGQRGERRTVFREAGAEDDHCQADAFRIGQVFRNLFENALAACTDPVEVTVRCTATDIDGLPYLRVAVSDNGPGFPAELEGRVFQPFVTTKLHGTGLGLAVARRIVEAHGGRISARPAEGGGAEVVITLPKG